MYRISINGREKEIKAEGLTMENGVILFFIDKECTKSKMIVASGEWEYLEVGEDSDAIQVRRPAQVPVQPEAESSEEVCKARLQADALLKEATLEAEAELKQERDKAEGNGFEDHPALQPKKEG